MRLSDLEEQVSMLRDEIGMDADPDIYACEFGYRSSNLMTIEDVVSYEDEREEDDWGNEKDAVGKTLFIVLGGTAGNRYPPPGLRDAVGEF